MVHVLFPRPPLWAIATSLVLGASSCSAQARETFDAQIRVTSHGVAHILARDLASAGFGEGYVFAQTDLCEIAERWVTVNAQRSRYFGPDARLPEAPAATNLQSDFYWQWISDSDVVGRELRQPPPRGPTKDVRDLVRGYVAGYNFYLANTGADRIADSRCRGAAWLRPITERDVYLRALHWSLFSTSVPMIPRFVNAAPPALGMHKKTAAAPAGGLARAKLPEHYSIGSNMIALGKDATDNGRGMLFANPHWYWEGPERFFEVQLTVPGKLNVYGAAILGMPMIVVGHTQGVAWSHTVSTPLRSTIYQLQLAAGDPTTYVYDGRRRKLESRVVRVQAKAADGKLRQHAHRFWQTPYGLLLKDDAFDWTDRTAFALRDVTLSLYWMNKQMALNQAQSIDDIKAAGRRYLAIPWVNTMAADSTGKVLYADNTAIPHITDAKLDACVSSALAKRLLPTRVIVLDGSRSACAWGNDADSIQPGTFGPGKLPELTRTDYVTNSNDSYWTNNPRQLLEGYPRIMGSERTARSLRTRIGLYKIERRLGGMDGYPGNRFTLANLEAITMDNTVLSGELWRDAVVQQCRTLPQSEGMADACDVLAKWDLAENLDSPGAVLWRRFFENIMLGYRAQSEDLPAELFPVAFDPHDALRTPRGLDTEDPRVQAALTTAVHELQAAGIALDATLRSYQYVDRNGTRIPIPGGHGALGQYNHIQTRKGWNPSAGWPDVFAGSSFILWVQFTDTGPRGRSVLTYSQSSNPESPLYADQTRLFSASKSKPILFTDAEIAADPNLTVFRICTDAARPACRVSR